MTESYQIHVAEWKYKGAENLNTEVKYKYLKIVFPSLPTYIKQMFMIF